MADPPQQQGGGEPLLPPPPPPASAFDDDWDSWVDAAFPPAAAPPAPQSLLPRGAAAPQHPSPPALLAPQKQQAQTPQEGAGVAGCGIAGAPERRGRKRKSVSFGPEVTDNGIVTPPPAGPTQPQHPASSQQPPRPDPADEKRRRTHPAGIIRQRLPTPANLPPAHGKPPRFGDTTSSRWQTPQAPREQVFSDWGEDEDQNTATAGGGSNDDGDTAWASTTELVRRNSCPAR